MLRNERQRLGLWAALSLVGFVGCGDDDEDAAESESEAAAEAEAEGEGECADGKVCCPGGEQTCEAGELCRYVGLSASYECVAAGDCREEKVCGRQCCPLGTECVDDDCPLPDLYVNGDAAEPFVGTKIFAEDACELDPSEGPCVGGPGVRTLLRFTTQTPNIGEGDLFLGAPEDYPEFYLFDSCPSHNHPHFNSYAKYELLDADGKVVGLGGKRAFCLLDWGPGDLSEARFNCDFQGISAGWFDDYGSYLSCQWIDITEVPSGDYTLRISLNFEGLLTEASYDNNVTEIPVEIPSNSCTRGCATDPDCCLTDEGCDGDKSCDSCRGIFDTDDCAICGDTADVDCPDYTSCPEGCTKDDAECCVEGDPCGWGADDWCDCGGELDWDSADCSSCECNPR